MNEYRREIVLNTETPYYFVVMGHIPNTPGWHQQMYKNNSYAFPTRQAADLFADNHRRMYPGRVINIREP